MKNRKKRSAIWKIERIQLQNIVETAKTFSEILIKFNLNNKGGNIKTLKNRLKIEGITFDHIKQGRDSNKGKHFNKKCHLLKDVLVAGSSYSRNTLKKRLIKIGLLNSSKCNICELLPKWNGSKLVFVLDHINGISNDNRIENLRLLCPNCNSQTDTFAGKRKKYTLGNSLTVKTTDFESVRCGLESSFPNQ